EFDFKAGVGRVKLFGINIRTFELKKEARAEQPVKATPITKEIPEEPKKPRIEKRQRSFSEAIAIAVQSAGAIWKYVVEVLKSVVIEECEGEIQAGFDSPHITGQMYGYYFAVVGAVPAMGKFRFVPDWTGASFSGSMRVSVALPLYKLLYRSFVLIIRLPIGRIYRFARGKRKGVSHDE
ncbi:MAG TPA: hypothetical protein VMS71_07025, partial [Candidatus Acidoferrum sp.]|nr:hypothetical protein [Candidatus Acidoferrum sp.]